MRVKSSIMIGVATALVAGCGAQRAEFSNRPGVEELIPEVQDHIRWVLDGNGDPDWPGYFGTPTDMVAWERLPLQYHVAQGSLTGVGGAVADGQPGAVLNVSLSTENRPIEPELRVAFLTGAFLGAEENATVEAFNPATGLLAIQEDGYRPAPAVGDRFVIGPGLILERGRVLYAEHCQHCHGVSGDGNGPTAKYLSPKPRDYRLGKFKFTSTATSDRAARADLKTTIREGIPGTYMPSFKLLTENEMQSIVEYVLWLSMRGEIEYRQVQIFRNDYSEVAVENAIADARESEEGLSYNDARQRIVDELNEYLTGDWQDEFNDDTRFLAEQWRNAQEETAVIVPKEAMPVYDYDSPEAVAARHRGRELFLSAKAKCATCHGDTGLGDGPQTLAVQKNTTTNAEYDLPGLYDDWGNPIIPRNLTSGIYRGGRRPVDLYRRIFAGIKGTPMPAFGTVLKDPEIWDLILYVQSIPFEHRKQRPGDLADEPRPEPPPVEAQTASTGTTAAAAETN